MESDNWGTGETEMEAFERRGKILDITRIIAIINMKLTGAHTREHDVETPLGLQVARELLGFDSDRGRIRDLLPRGTNDRVHDSYFRTKNNDIFIRRRVVRDNTQGGKIVDDITTVIKAANPQKFVEDLKSMS